MFLQCVSDLALDFNEEDLVAEPSLGVCLTFQDYKFDLFLYISRWGGRTDSRHPWHEGFKLLYKGKIGQNTLYPK